MTTETLTIYEVAARLRCGRQKIATVARRHGIGMQLGGSAGWRFTEADYARLLAALSPAPEPAVRRRRRRSA